jgi:hypothetical protein
VSSAPTSPSALPDKKLAAERATDLVSEEQSSVDAGTCCQAKGKGKGSMAQNMVNCSVTLEQGITSDIRTKVFRMGAPLLRTTIPISIGGRGGGGYPGGYPDAAASKVEGQGYGSKDLPIARPENEDDTSDVETVISMDEMDGGDFSSISVTLDFPC